jgi:acetylornithine deacetylase/succinyl-diaminopimelate desuccinylase-like protein
MIDRVLKNLETSEPQAIDRLCDWLRIASISADPAYKVHCQEAAQWAADRLDEAGLTARVLPTGSKDEPGHPCVLAKTPNADTGAGPHVLFYGHYDVQPPDPLELWESGPFEPVVKKAGGKVKADQIVARGASDDKGQVAMFLEALRAWKEESGEPAGGLRVTVLLEGEEESGSENLARFLSDYEDELKGCDFCLISDTGMISRTRPAITYGVRGLAYTQIRLHGPDKDVHSGFWGGRMPNPLNELSKVLAQMWDENRHVAIDGFYDDVVEATDEERAGWKALNIDIPQMLGNIGLGPEADIGEAGFTSIEREWARPTAEINGMWGGYTGAGAKTVIPAYATAKVSFRLVANQDPADIVKKFFAWLQGRTPPGCRWELQDMHGGHPSSVDPASEWLAKARQAMEKSTGMEVALIKTGGSIPVAGMLKDSLGLDTVFMGFGLDDDRVHSPNEKFELPCFRMGARSHAVLIDLLRGGGA